MEQLNKPITKQADGSHLKFLNKIQFFECLMQHHLYNTKTDEYAFICNDNKAICVHSLPLYIVATMCGDTKHRDDWIDQLSKAGQIYEFPENYHWCEDSYASDYWIKVDDFKKWYKKAYSMPKQEVNV